MGVRAGKARRRARARRGRGGGHPPPPRKRRGANAKRTLRDEADVGGLEGVVIGEGNVDCEGAALVGGAGRARHARGPLLRRGLALGLRRHALGRVGRAELRELRLQALEATHGERHRGRRKGAEARPVSGYVVRTKIGVRGDAADT